MLCHSAHLITVIEKVGENMDNSKHPSVRLRSGGMTADTLPQRGHLSLQECACRQALVSNSCPRDLCEHAQNKGKAAMGQGRFPQILSLSVCWGQ